MKDYVSKARKKLTKYMVEIDREISRAGRGLPRSAELNFDASALTRCMLILEERIKNRGSGKSPCTNQEKR